MASNLYDYFVLVGTSFNYIHDTLTLNNNREQITKWRMSTETRYIYIDQIRCDDIDSHGNDFALQFTYFPNQKRIFNQFLLDRDKCNKIKLNRNNGIADYKSQFICGYHVAFDKR